MIPPPNPEYLNKGKKIARRGRFQYTDRAAADWCREILAASVGRGSCWWGRLWWDWSPADEVNANCNLAWPTRSIYSNATLHMDCEEWSTFQLADTGLLRSTLDDQCKRMRTYRSNLRADSHLVVLITRLGYGWKIGNQKEWTGQPVPDENQ